MINGEKWFSSNAHYSSFLIVMAVTDPDAPPYKRLSTFIVPTDAPGVNIVRSVGVGQEAERHAMPTCAIRMCTVPKDHLLGPRGGGFVVAQTRLGGGRIHHAMRTIGQVRKAFDLMCERVLSRTTQGSLLADKQMVQEKIADSWIDIEQFRLLVLRTAWRIDKYKDYLKVRKDIAAVKAQMPKVFHDVAVRALQIHGSLGVTPEMPFVEQVMESFVMGLADGPTEVHKITLARQVLRDYKGTKGLFPSGHIPALREAAIRKYADRIEARGGRAMTHSPTSIRFQRQSGGDNRRQPRHRPCDGAGLRGRRRQTGDRKPQDRLVRSDRQGNSRARQRRFGACESTSANGQDCDRSRRRSLRALGPRRRADQQCRICRRWRRRRWRPARICSTRSSAVNLKGPFRLTSLFALADDQRTMAARS